MTRYFSQVVLALAVFVALPLAAHRENRTSPYGPPLPVAFGEIFTVIFTSQGVVTTTPALLTTFDANGLSLDTTPDHTLDQITIEVSGIYHVSFSVSFEAIATIDYNFQVAVNGVPEPKIAVESNGAGGIEPASASVSGFLSLSAGDVVTVLIAGDSGPSFLTVERSNLNVKRVQ